MAVRKGNISLARYVRQQLPTAQQKTANTYITLHRHPERINVRQINRLPEAQRNQIASHTLKRLAYRYPERAKELFEHHAKEWNFNQEQRNDIIRAVGYGYTKQDPERAISWMVRQDPNSENEYLLEQRIRLALSSNQWQAVYQWILLLPQETQAKNRWLYWRAKAQQRTGIQPFQPELQSEAILEKLASSRDYYGFLAADQLGLSYQMQDDEISIPTNLLDRVEKIDGIARALELFAVGDISSARREWWHAAKSLNADEIIAAAKIAKDRNLHPTAIHSMVKAKAWNDLSTRFPLAYEENIINTAMQENIDTNWLYAIARQESAFAHDAKSSAGALGVLQLMPATARQTAKSMGMRYSRHALLTPTTNIKIGGSYLAKLFRQFDGNRVLATAAYNAGPHRVRQWLRNSKQPLEQDVWIETIPFKETRHYVQNVLTFSVIYGYRRDDHRQLVRSKENIIAYN